MTPPHVSQPNVSQPNVSQPNVSRPDTSRPDTSRPGSSKRAGIAMDDEEVAAFLRDGGKLQLATINPDGTPHLVTMFYGLADGKITFWTYRKAQKARNLERDPRVTCLVETGDEYAELRGVMIYGKARLIDDPEEVLSVGMDVTRRMTGMPSSEEAPQADDPLRAYVAHTARKRIAFVVEPTRTVSWDHRKLPGASVG
ncbi:PPOX class F420-dependent enzyme [Planotetraspora thailandica]|uniref:PPOX class F420-dependent enzyme n=1 Tax=Planotetraspora thailandica TaxID=487172 RepID=A0A8J3XUU6_9ACTN|nr:pyridoxamine 5'-phosphate oxidase family protein [Planotetraspora thailandica]GII55822.1 PPOX class F420-dependent enzyme [Planotetraspora thailandica]